MVGAFAFDERNRPRQDGAVTGADRFREAFDLNGRGGGGHGVLSCVLGPRDYCSASSSTSPPTEGRLAALARAKASTAWRVVTVQPEPKLWLQNFLRVASSASFSSMTKTRYVPSASL